MGSDFLYANAPLVEVIAEVHWKLQPLQVPPNASIDPHFETFEKDFLAACKSAGYDFVENVFPMAVPREFLGHKVLRRMRKKADSWPLFQLGPGVIAINIVPPYKGWQEFVPLISQGLSMLFSSYPIPQKYLEIEKLELRYMDAFVPKHGVTDRASFIRDDLGMARQLPQGIIGHADASQEPVSQTGSAQVSVKKPANSEGLIQVETGTADKDPAVLVTFIIRTKDHKIAQDQTSIVSWFDQSHVVIREWFDVLISDRVKQLLGPKTSI